jgi:CDP-glucose 4,6-dehydratase
MESLVSKNNFWKNKKVLITGHSGFKGSWLTLILNLKGAKLFGISLHPNTTPNLFTILGNHRRINSSFTDIRNYEPIKKIIRKIQPDVIFHLAAQPLVRDSYRNPVDTFATNIMGTVNILDILRENLSVKVFLNITSDKCYENNEQVWGYRENDPMGGKDPYSSSKGCSELITSAFRHSFFNDNNMSISSVRAGNVIGGGDWSNDRLIPDLVRSLTSNKKIIVRQPLSTRPWQHVLDPLSGYIELAEKMYKNKKKYIGAWNFGPENSKELNVKQIVREFESFFNKKNIMDVKLEKKLYEARTLKLDISKVKNYLNWSPVLNIDEALGYTFSWYKEYISRGDMEKFSITQINKFYELKKV